jgi:PIN domain nuclease of toxin-antitoxin system
MTPVYVVNLDTHILIFALLGELRPRERELLSEHAWGISGIVLWELAKLVELGRVDMDLGARSVRQALASVHTWHIDLETARAATTLDIKGDPADQLIAATSLVHEVPLLTRDARIRRSKVVPLA